MLIFIPTMGRKSTQKTLRNLPSSLRELTTLVVPTGEVGSYEFHHRNTKIIGTDAKGIAATRQWILEQNKNEKFLVMLDDDLDFFYKDAERKIKPITVPQHEAAFGLLEEWVKSGFTHAGITIRSLNWQHPGPHMEVTRLMHVLAYNPKAVLKAGCDFTKGVNHKFSMDDFHMTLQLLRKGHPNRLNVDACINPSPSNSAGGASLWRTLETQNYSAERLAALHPDFVSVRVKKAEWKGMEGERKDVVVQWRKAYGK